MPPLVLVWKFQLYLLEVIHEVNQRDFVFDGGVAHRRYSFLGLASIGSG